MEGVRFRYTRLGGARPTVTCLTHPIEGSDFTLDADSVIPWRWARPPTPGPSRRPPGVPRRPGHGRHGPTGGLGRGGLRPGGLHGDRGHGERPAGGLGNPREPDGGRQAGPARPRGEPRAADAGTSARDFLPRQDWAVSEVGERLADPSCGKRSRGFDPEAGTREARRCYGCDEHYVIDPGAARSARPASKPAPEVHRVGPRAADDPDEPGALRWEWVKDWALSAVTVAVDNARCIRCGACAAVCPRRCVTTQRIGLEPSRRVGRE